MPIDVDSKAHHVGANPSLGDTRSQLSPGRVRANMIPAAADRSKPLCVKSYAATRRTDPQHSANLKRNDVRLESRQPVRRRWPVVEK